MRCSIVGTITVNVIWCRSISSTARAASNFSRITTFAPSNMIGAANENPFT